ncbi:UNVERIFIED_CONTAM: hypothetical protein K2H54_017961 [Gekko kuhli]
MSWQHSETLELLALWGDIKIQEELSHSTRNIVVYQKIAKGLAAKGFVRTAEQCRSKTKDLRMRYKEAMAHNQVSEGDHETPLTQEAEEGAEDEGNEGDMDDLPPLEGTSASTQIVECQSPPATNPTDAEFPPAVVMGKLSPKSRLAYIRARTKRVSAVQKVGDKMLEESIRQNEAARQQHWELMLVFNASVEEERQSREALTGVLQGALAALNVLIRGNEGEGGTQPGGNSISTQGGMKRKKRPREPYSPSK